jgi:hypothetical protein
MAIVLGTDFTMGDIPAKGMQDKPASATGSLYDSAGVAAFRDEGIAGDFDDHAPSSTSGVVRITVRQRQGWRRWRLLCGWRG